MKKIFFIYLLNQHHKCLQNKQIQDNFNFIILEKQNQTFLSKHQVKLLNHINTGFIILNMQLVKKTQNNFFKSSDFRQQYTSENTSRHGISSRINQPKQKRFKRNKNDKSNNSRSSSNCSQSSQISKFYVKNITNLIPPTSDIISKNNINQKQKQTKMFQSQQNYKNKVSPCSKQLNSPQKALDSYGLGKDSQKITSKSIATNLTDNSINVTSFLQRQFSPQIQPQKSPQPCIKRLNKKQGNINLIQDSYNFLNPNSNNITKKISPLFQQSKNNPNPKLLLQQLTSYKNKIAQLNLELQKNKNNQKKLTLLNQQYQIKFKRQSQKIVSLQQDLNKSNQNNLKLKDENHRMKILVKQRDSLMTSIMEKQKLSAIQESVNYNKNKQSSKQINMKKNGQYLHEQTKAKLPSTSNNNNNSKPSARNQSLVTKLIEYQFENQKLRNTINKQSKHLQQIEYLQQQKSTSFQRQSSTLSINNGLPVSISQITWDDKQFTDCLQQKQKLILQLRQQIKNLQIEINYLNRKWMNEVERVKKLQKFQYIKLKDKYKQMLIKYNQKVKANFVLPPSRQQWVKANKSPRTPKSPKKRQNFELQRKQIQGTKQNKQIKQTTEYKQLKQNPQSNLTPRRRKRNYTVDHLKGRGIMSDIRINYGCSNKIGNPYEDISELQLLEYSSCEEDMGY